MEKELAGTGTLKGMPGRLKLVRPSSRESANSFNGVSKQSIRSTHQEGIEPLSRNTSIQSIGPGNPKMVPTDKRALRHFEPQGAGIAFLGQNTTSAQQAQQKEEIVNKLGNTKRMNSGEGTIHLPSINAKPSDKSFNPNGTLKLVKPDTSQPSLGNGFRMRTAEADKRSAPGLGEPFGGPHQPRIMKQNVPYKPLSSHAPTRPNNLAIDTPKSDPKSSHLEHREIRKGPTSTGQNFFNSKGYTNQPENSMEPSTSQDNLFFDLDRSSNNPSLRVSDSNKKGLSFNDETNFESNTQEQRITLQYYESFGKTANLNEMCRNGGQAQSSLDQRMQNSGLSDKMNFTFGPNDLPKELLESNGRLDNNQTGNFPEQKSELVDKNNHWQISENMKKDGIKVSSSAIKIKNKEGNQISSFDPSSNKFKPTLEPRLVQENNYEPKALSRDHEERHERAVLEKDRIKIRPPSQAFKEPLQSPPKDPPKPRIPIKIVSSQRPLIQGSATQENPEVARQASKGKPPRIVPTKREEEMNSPQQDRQANPNTGLRSLTPGQEGVRPPQKLNSFATQLRPERLVVKRPQIE